jgi:hypothetical protein
MASRILLPSTKIVMPHVAESTMNSTLRQGNFLE